MWHEGTIGIPVKGSDKMTVVHYWVKAYDEPSAYGINEGKISKLRIEIDGQVVASYDRGWDIKPDENNTPALLAYSILLQNHN